MPFRVAPEDETSVASRPPYILPLWKMWPRPSHWVPHCRNMVTWSSAKPQPKGIFSKPASFCRPAAWSVPVATMLCSGFTRPKAPVWGPCMSKLRAQEITLPLRTRLAARLTTSGVMKLSVPISSSGPQRPQFRNLVQYSSSSAGVTAGRLASVRVLTLGAGLIVRSPYRLAWPVDASGRLTYHGAPEWRHRGSMTFGDLRRVCLGTMMLALWTPEGHRSGAGQEDARGRKEGRMATDRREFMKVAGSAAAAVSAMSAAGVASAAECPARIKSIKAFAFDAYGTLFDVFSVTALCEQLFPGKGNALAQLWRAKQLQYSLLRSLMGRHKDFWQLTDDGLVFASKSLKLDLTPEKRKQLMEAYLSLTAFPDVKPGLEALKKQGLRLAILSNGEPRMLEAAAKIAGIDSLLDTIISVEEVKIFKVSPRVYNLGPERMKVNNAELGFVSSNSWDVNGAASAGLTTLWIQRSPGEPPEELGFAADRVVSAITDLAPLVRG